MSELWNQSPTSTDVLPLERRVTIVVVEGHYKALCRSHKQSNSQQNGQRGRRPQHEVEQEESQDDWTFSLNQEEVLIQFTDSVTKDQR